MHKEDATPVRLIVRARPSLRLRSAAPTRAAPGSQLALFVDYSYHAFITDPRGGS